jgi:hypothetical protein
MRVTATVLIVILAGCTSEPPRVVEAKSAISALLRDPESARFTEITEAGSCVLGKINAKNGFGGYSGASEFVYNAKLRAARIDPGFDPATLNIPGMNDVEGALAFSTVSLKCRQEELAIQRANNRAESALLKERRRQRQAERSSN